MYYRDVYRGSFILRVYLIFSRIERETDGGSYVQLASYMHGMTMRFDDVFTDRKT